MISTIFLPNNQPLSILGDKKDVSDGFHSFNDLYNHRVLLFLALMASHPHISWKALYHHDGTQFDNSFIAGMQLPSGQISYHIPLSFWNYLSNVKELTFAPPWDKHSPEDVLNRLAEWIRSL